MENITEILNKRFYSVLNCSTVPLFYKGIHEYIDFILTTPQLEKIMSKSREEYTTKHTEIWKTKVTDDRQADEQVEATNRLETFSLYARDYAFLYGRVYQYIENYKQNTEPDGRPYPEAMIMLQGINNIKTDLWSKEVLQMISNWYTERERREYMSRLTQFHTSLLDELDKLPKTELQSNKTRLQIIIDDRKGIYENNNPKLSYGIKKNSKRSNLIKHLISKDNCGIAELENLTHQTTDVTIRCVSEINRLFREKLQLTDDLILHLNTGGYSLNKEVFDIRIQ